MSDDSLADRLGLIEDRLARIEAALGLQAAARTSPPLAPVALQTVAATQAPDDLRLADEVTPVDRPPARWAGRVAAWSHPEPPVAVPYAAAAVVPPRPPPVPDRSIEQAIGLKVAGWAGAIAVVAAVGWAIQWAYVHGYFGAVPPGVRIGLLTAAGLALVAAGEWVYRRVNVLSAAGLFGAGVAVLFLASYAGYAYYDLYGPHVAFVLLGASTVLGAAVARRANLVSIAVLSVVGGNLAPVLIHTATPSAGSFLVYLLMLQVVALSLAYLGRERKWWTLRGLSLATTGVWFAGVLGTPALAASPLAPPFLLAYAALFQAELIASALSIGDSPADGATVGFSVTVTAALVVGLLVRFAGDAAAGRIAWVLGVAAATGGLAVACRRGRRAVGMLSVGYAVQAMALVVVAVPVAVGGVWVAVGWAALAVAYAAVGRLLKATVASRLAPAVWLLAVADLACWANGAFGPPHAREVALTVAGTAVPTYAVMAGALALIGHVVARTEADRPLARLLSAVAAGVWAVAALLALPPLGATAVLLAYAGATAAASLVGAGEWLVPQAVAVVALAAVKWVVDDTTLDRLVTRVPAQLGLVDPAAAVGVAVAGSVLAAYLGRDRWLPALARPSPRVFAGCSLAVALLLAWAASLEAVRAVRVLLPAGTGFSEAEWGQLLSTACWAAALAGHLLLATWPTRLDAGRRVAALNAVAALPALLAAKFVVVDAVALSWFGGPAGGPAAPVANPRAAVAAALVGLLVLQRLAAGRLTVGVEPIARRLPVAAAVLLALVAGSFEVHQAFAWLGLANTGGLAEAVALSIFWAVFSVGSIVAGFTTRTAGLRYFGLALFAVTGVKVLAVDESHVDSGGRVLSFLAVGLLLLGTSVLYGKVSPTARAGARPAADEAG